MRNGLFLLVTFFVSSLCSAQVYQKDINFFGGTQLTVAFEGDQNSCDVYFLDSGKQCSTISPNPDMKISINGCSAVDADREWVVTISYEVTGRISEKIELMCYGTSGATGGAGASPKFTYNVCKNLKINGKADLVFPKI